MTTRLPLAVAAMVLIAAAGTTQWAVQGLSQQIERQLDRMGQIYLDGLGAALLPPVIRDDREGIARTLQEALRLHQGLVDRRLFVLDAQRQPLARADRAGLEPVAMPEAVAQSPYGHWLDDEDSSYWIWRPLTDDRLDNQASAPLRVVANLDVTSYVSERRQLWWRVVALDLALSLACALVALVLVRRLQRPVAVLTEHLQRSTEQGPEPVPQGLVNDDDQETARLLQAYNHMALAAQDREALLTRMAEQEREAVLGRMAATLAHEVRNPLAGVLTAIDTLRKFGDQPQTRAEALDFMERGMRALAGVADATLATHRPPQDLQAFGPQDLLDIQRLIEPQARRARVRLHVDSTLAQAVPVGGHEVRQILLNLLLNAVKASPPDSDVTLRCTLQPLDLRLEVLDPGPGMPAVLAQHLQAGTEPTDEAGLGVAVVIRLLQQLRGRVTVVAQPGRGTHITLDLPLAPPPAAD